MNPRPQKLAVAVAISGAFLVFTVGCGLDLINPVYLFRGPYGGVVLDEETKEPLEGAVVLAYWLRDTLTPAGAISSFAAATEVVTDKEGRFRFTGGPLRPSIFPFTFVDFPSVTIYRAGYGNYPYRHASPKPSGGYREALSRGDLRVFLPRLTTRQQREAALRHLPPVMVPHAQMPMLLREMNLERSELRLPTYELRPNQRLHPTASSHPD